MTKDYVLGTSDTEMERLGFQHQVWQVETAQLWRNAGFGYGQRLLDLGCGPGLATVELARLVGPAGSVLGLDRSDKFVDTCGQRVLAESLRNVTVQQADAESYDLEQASFDGVFIRWLLCFLPDPEAVIQRVAACLKPGGTLAVVDYYHYLSVSVEPRVPAIQRIFEAYGQSTQGARYGFDVGGELSRMLSDAGLELASVVPWVRAGRPGSNIWRWVELFHHGFGNGLVEMGLMSEDEMAAFWRAWQQVAGDPRSVFSSPPMLAIVARKPG